MISAGDNPFIKAVILVMPFFSGAFDESNYPPGLMDDIRAERKKLCSDPSAQPSYVPIWDNSEEEAAKEERGKVVLHGLRPYKFISEAKELSDAAGTPWENRISLQSLYDIVKVEPQDHVYKIAPRALLYLAAAKDEISGPIESHRAVFERAREPKQFVELQDHHIENYEAELFKTNLAAQVEFLKKYV
jgi:hypothetical protein